VVRMINVSISDIFPPSQLLEREENNIMSF